MSTDPVSSDLCLSPYCKILVRHRRPRVLALVFSPVGDPPGRFALESALRQVGADAVLLNVPERSYFLRGIPGLGNNLEACLAGLRRIVAEVGAEEVAAIGLSMGGYGAALFGAELGVQRVLSMAGETLLLQPGSRSRRNIGDRFQPSHPDIRPQIEAASDTRFDFLCGEQDVIDLYSAWRVRDLPNVRVYPVRNASHEIARWLARRGALVPFLSAFLDRGEIDERCLDPGTAMATGSGVADLFESQRAFLSGDLVGSLRSAELAAAALPGVGLAQFQLGQALERAGRKAEAEARLRAAVELDGTVVEYRTILARVLVTLDKCDDARALLEAALAEAPRSALAHHVQGNLLARCGDYEAAVIAQRRAIAIEGANASYPSALGQAYLALGSAEQALDAFRSAVGLNPKQGYLHYLLGRALAALDRVDEAEAAFAQAVSLEPGNATYRRAQTQLRRVA